MEINLFKDTLKDPYNSMMRSEYNNMKNRLTNLISNAKIIFNTHQIRSRQNDLKQIWNIVQEMVGTNSK